MFYSSSRYSLFFKRRKVYITNAANQVSVNSTNLQSIGIKAWVQVSNGSGTLNQIVFQRNQAAGASFAGINKTVPSLDGGAQLNTDQVWTPYVHGTCVESSLVDTLFNGDTT